MMYYICSGNAALMDANNQSAVLIHILSEMFSDETDETLVVGLEICLHRLYGKGGKCAAVT